MFPQKYQCAQCSFSSRGLSHGKISVSTLDACNMVIFLHISDIPLLNDDRRDFQERFLRKDVTATRRYLTIFKRLMKAYSGKGLSEMTILNWTTKSRDLFSLPRLRS